MAVDASAGMLAEATAKPWPTSVQFVHSPIEAISRQRASTDRSTAFSPRTFCAT